MKIKTCPFCGRYPKTYWDFTDTEQFYKEGFNIVCCVVNICRIHEEDTIEVWNTRYQEETK